MISLKNSNTIHWSIYLLVTPVVIAAGLWLALHGETGLAIVVFSIMAGISWLVSYFELQLPLITMLALLLPFSVEVPVTNELSVNLPSEPLLAIVVFSLFWDFLRKPGHFKQFINREDLWILPLLICFLVTTLFSTLFWVSAKFAVVNITYIVVFYIWQKHLFRTNPDLFPRLMGLYSLSLLLVLLFSIVQFKNYDWNPVTIRGIFAPFYKDNTIFGAASALVASFWLAFIFITKVRTAKIIYLFLALIFLGATALSTSRAAALSILLFLIVLIVFRYRVRLRYIALFVIMGLLVIAVFRNPIYDFLKENKHQSHTTKFGYMEQLESSGNISSDISNLERLNRWIAGWGMFQERPIVGFGPGTYQFAYIPYQKKEFMNRLTVKDPWHIPENSGGTAHSEYILALSEMGIIGLAALLTLFGRWMWLSFVRARNHPRQVNITMGFAVIVTYLFHALFNNFLNTDKFAFLFWGVAAWMVSQFQLKDNGQYRI